MPGALAANVGLVPWAYGRWTDGATLLQNSGHYEVSHPSEGIYLLTPTKPEYILTKKQGMIMLAASAIGGGSSFDIAVKEQDWDDETGIITVAIFGTAGGTVTNGSFSFIVFRNTEPPPGEDSPA